MYTVMTSLVTSFHLGNFFLKLQRIRLITRAASTALLESNYYRLVSYGNTSGDFFLQKMKVNMMKLSDITCDVKDISV